MSEPMQKAKSIFLDAIAISDLDDRSSFLESACAGDSPLRQHVDRLIAAHEQTDSLFDRTTDEYSAGPVEKPGDQMGPYKVREVIGEGGMGTVYVAEQQKPIRRKVAVKVIKPGMDSKLIFARFDAERQALALMDHPNIAKVLDAGTTENGRPYFVMELIQGQPITEYCDEKKLTVRERLSLFIDVCQAVQHAHQKGIIHRDIKPNNVLITEVDGKAVPKVIDFGVAKALSSNLTDQSIYTNFQTLVGTPLYMSPEQAKLSGVDVDTRSDVYSLGVLLYELLSGDVPFDKERIKQAAIDEVCRIIREEDPPSLSQRVSSMGDGATQVSVDRGIQASDLIRLFKNELTWIVSKAMDKDRDRRYETPRGLANDITAYLTDDVVAAGPLTMKYKLAKQIRRYRGPIAVATTMAAMLLGATFVSMKFGLDARRERNLAQSVLASHSQQLVQQAYDLALAGDAVRTEEIISQLDSIGTAKLDEIRLRGVAAFYGGDQMESVDLFHNVLEKNPRDLVSNAMLSLIYGYNGKLNLSQRYLRIVLDLKPENETEKFFKAYAIFYTNYEQTERMLDELLLQRPGWAVARALYGAVNFHQALDAVNASERAAYIDVALTSVQTAETVAPKNPFVLTVSLWVHGYACSYVNDQREIQLAERAAELDKRLALFPRYCLGQSLRGEYHFRLGDNQKAIDIIRSSGHWPDALATILYGTGQFEAACEVFSDDRLDESASFRLKRAIFEIEAGQIEKHRTKLDHWNETHEIWFGMDANEIANQTFALEYALRLGQCDIAQSKARELLENLGDKEYIAHHMIPTKLILEFIAGEKTEKEFLFATQGSRELTQNAYFWMTLWHLGKGDRVAFQETLERLDLDECGTIYSSHWGWAMREQLNADPPKWPGWLAINEVNSN